ncbi:DUF6596 domain-containing protein [Aureliella helgolandensis]|uniref:DUF6596 domain-containing protein n=1 Tax=Aureliella helgolandensis TaxID=2527968 RepID=UPI0028F448E7|nr:DUF6596 domain-containing protein [Aureliella helgolandensis]
MCLAYNEDYSASGGEALIRAELSGEVIRLAHLLLELLPDSEGMGLLALLLLLKSQRSARMSDRAIVLY